MEDFADAHPISLSKQLHFLKPPGLNLIHSRRVVEVKGWRTEKYCPAVRNAWKHGVMTANKDALLAEERKLRRLCRAMDITATLLWHVNLTLEEAQDVVQHAKVTALELFPDKEETFDLIYGARFRRILTEKYRLV
jgi:hypothetical protein